MKVEIQANDLMVGNLLKYVNGDNIFKVIGIHEFGVDCEDEIETTYMEYENFEPIPLTEEWLVRFGFELLHKNNKHYVINDPNGFKDSHKISIFPTINEQWHIAFSDTLGGYKDYIPSTKIKYVHQLQNLYYTLTNEHLTIK